ncbi:hypothetical protein ACFWZ2_41720 [Streptomyces sp. NPDC059002]|uniref:hypothetical protein n=1 Tax=Streptomyces sp. NPDC059002 TaxID=3346690 RepID=UPI00369782DE
MAALGHGTHEDLNRAAPEHSAAYLRMGLLTGLYAIAAAAWIGYELEDRGAGADDFLTALYDARAPLTPWAQTPQDWALIVAALVFGGIALARRRVARGALMLLAVVLIGLSLRELVGLTVSEDYRTVLERSEYGQLLITFRVIGLIVGVAILIELARAGRRTTAMPYVPYDATPSPYAPYGPYTPPHPSYGPPPAFRPAGVRPQLAAAGVCLLLSGAVAVAWLVYRLTRPQVYLVGGSPDAGVGGFFRDVVDASYSTSIPYSFHTAAFALAPLLVALLLFRGRQAGRGAGLALAFVLLYLDARTLYAYAADGEIDQYFDSTLGTLAVLSTAFTTVLSLVTATVLLAAREE